MSDRLQPILSLLDEGLAIYRRHFARFVLIAACWFVPMAILTGAMAAGSIWLTPLLSMLLILAVTLLSMPLVVYLVGGLSRAAAAAIDGRAVSVREALAIPPRRALSMGCFTLIYSIVMQVVSSALTMICICPLWVFGFGFVGVLGATGGESAMGAAALVLVGVFLGGVYLFALLVGGASYSSLIYALQPWVQESQPFGQSIERSFQLVGYRFWRNAVAWALSAALLAAGGVVVAATVGVLASLPLLLLLGTESQAAQAVAGTAWLAGLVLVVPPLPIWMALLYRRNREARSGGDLEARVQAWMEEGAREGEALPATHPAE
jgi:hypothetical protein